MEMKARREVDLTMICHMNRSREECMQLLVDSGKIGAFLIRKSVTVSTSNVLSVLVAPGASDGIYNYLLTENKDGKIGLSLSQRRGPGNVSHQKWQFFDSLKCLIECCSGTNTPLKVALTYPVYDDEYVRMNFENLDGRHYVQNDNEIRNNDGAAGITKTEEILQNLKCMVCTDFAANAVETQCCYQLFCKKCSPSDELCSRCKKPCQIQIPGTIRKIIGDLPTVCFHAVCGTRIKRSELQSHESNCEFQIKFCVFNNCDYSCCKLDMPLHVFSVHQQEAMARIEAS